VPIKAPVSGVAMGLITDSTGRYQILTDIQGTEDHLGDMDFKVAGTAEGITALQMDIKISGLSTQMMKEALAQANTARMAIMEKMLAVIDAPRAELKPHAPRIITVKIPIDKIGALIGPGGKNIRALQEQTHTKIDIEEDGTVYIASTDSVGAKIARNTWKDSARLWWLATFTPAKLCASKPLARSSTCCPAWTDSCTSHNWQASA